jgi:hypothetical protein
MSNKMQNLQQTIIDRDLGLNENGKWEKKTKEAFKANKETFCQDLSLFTDYLVY